jgi:hypothetical protein
VKQKRFTILAASKKKDGMKVVLVVGDRHRPCIAKEPRFAIIMYACDVVEPSDGYSQSDGIKRMYRVRYYSRLELMRWCGRGLNNQYYSYLSIHSSAQESHKCW